MTAQASDCIEELVQQKEQERALREKSERHNAELQVGGLLLLPYIYIYIYIIIYIFILLYIYLYIVQRGAESLASPNDPF
eukprot:SAG31_NODE_1610_length_7751_cov_2.938447_8_plen_80_part_00